MIRSIIIAASAFAATVAYAQQNPEGRWNTGQGPVTISRDAAGYTLTFEQFPGKATATLKGDKLTGIGTFIPPLRAVNLTTLKVVRGMKLLCLRAALRVRGQLIRALLPDNVVTATGMS